MSYAQRMLETSPSGDGVDAAALAECIEACFDCAQACTACADACLGEENVQNMVRCIRLDLDCAEVCDATGRTLSRQTAFEPEMARAILEACARACRLCGDECEQHAEHMEHCRVCAEACRRCEQACNNVLSAISA
ncbi:MAG: four-helix bundle copper-binding protein [Actinomycetota bacterium]|nr:four-helix bundle copper-binding protein [Actinomycetota bacterium]